MCPLLARSVLGEKVLGTDSMWLLHLQSNQTDSSVWGWGGGGCVEIAPGVPDVKSRMRVVLGRWLLGEAQS